MKTLKVNETISFNGLTRKVTSIRWSEKNEGELIEKDEVLYDALCWCIIGTDEGERLILTYNNDFELVLNVLCKNGFTIQSNQYGFPCKTYYYIQNKERETYHHKDSKWRKKELKEMTTYAYYSAESAIKAFVELTTKTFYKLIEDETPILPEIAAESVVGNYYTENKIQVNSKEENDYYLNLITYLSKKANDIYNINQQFNKKIKASGNKGLDHLFMFMNHWLEGKLKTYKKLPTI